MALLLSGCKKEKDPPRELTSAMSANIAGFLWKSDDAYYSIRDGHTEITGKSEDGRAIILDIKGLQKGVYTLKNDSIYKCIGFVTNTTFEFTAPSAGVATDAAVYITEVNEEKKTISGTFSFTGALTGSKMSFTQGRFHNLKYKDFGVNTFSATLNGRDWTADEVSATRKENRFSITAKRGDAQFDFSLPVDLEEGFPNSFVTNQSEAYYTSTDTAMSSQSGTFTITEYDHRDRTLKGTFAFRLITPDIRRIADVYKGSFSVKYRP